MVDSVIVPPLSESVNCLPVDHEALHQPPSAHVPPMFEKERVMLRVPFVAAVIAAAAGALFFGSDQLRSDAQVPSPSTGGHAFIGSWRLTFDTPLGASQSLLTVMADGTVVFTGRPVSPATESAPVIFSSSAHGAWEQTGLTTAAATWVGLVSDGEGNFLAVVTDSVKATLAVDGNAWSGAYSATVAYPNGNVLYVGGSTVEATRITVQPLATPAGTPTA
jgi:hypothetical protein